MEAPATQESLRRRHSVGKQELHTFLKETGNTSWNSAQLACWLSNFPYAAMHSIAFLQFGVPQDAIICRTSPERERSRDSLRG